eukprot:328456-Chlamydomonas_euryale.AAC.1
MQYKGVFGHLKGLPPDRGIAHVIPEVEGAQPVYSRPYRLFFSRNRLGRHKGNPARDRLTE